MRANKKTISLIQTFEGLYSGSRNKSIPVKVGGLVYPYKDQTGTPTIGYGNITYLDGRKVTMSDTPITDIQATQLFMQTLSKFEKNLNNVVTTDLDENQFGALLSLSYNIGITNFNKSTLLKLVNQNPNNPLIEQQFLKWVNSKGQFLNGLKKRRIGEWLFYKKKTNNLKSSIMQKIIDFYQNNKTTVIVGAVALVVGLFFYFKKK